MAVPASRWDGVVTELAIKAPAHFARPEQNPIPSWNEDNQQAHDDQ